MKRNLKTVTDFAADSPFTEPQVRWWIFMAASNGLNSAIVRIGRRVYIDSDLFDDWIESQQGEAPEAPTPGASGSRRRKGKAQELP